MRLDCGLCVAGTNRTIPALICEGSPDARVDTRRVGGSAQGCRDLDSALRTK